MTNIPTDLLRTFVLVVELRSFTRAARAQGMTQPAVSAQIRRLQGLLGAELFDKSAPGVILTEQGERVIESARRLLSVNDQIVQIAGNGAAEPVRIGVRKDWMGDELVHMLAAARTRWPNLRFDVQGAGQQRLLRRRPPSMAPSSSEKAPATAGSTCWLTASPPRCALMLRVRLCCSRLSAPLMLGVTSAAGPAAWRCWPWSAAPKRLE